MITTIMRNKSEQLCALETELGFVRSNYHYGWDLAVNSEPECSLFSAIIAYLRQLHKIHSVVLFIAVLSGQ